MLKKEEADRIDLYLETHYYLNESDMEYLSDVDELVIDCSLDADYCKKNADRLLTTAEDVHRKMSAIFMLETCSPRLLYYQESYYQLLTLHAKATGKDDTAPLAMLCFSSSFDLFWLQKVKHEG